MPPRTSDYGDIAAIIQAAILPLVNKLQTLDEKVDKLSQDRVTRSDLDTLRREITGSFVPRDSYEPRHAGLVERNTQLESMIREDRKEHESDVQRLYERLESGKGQIEERMKVHVQETKTELEKQSQAQLSGKDRGWMRATQIVSAVAVLVAIIDFLSQHHFTF